MKRGLVSNPFSAARFKPGVIPWLGEGEAALERLFARAIAPRAVHQVRGAHGSGKTTLLTHLEAHARREGVRALRFRGGRGAPLAQIWALFRAPPAPAPRLLLVDEREELSALSFFAVKALAAMFGASIVMSVHRDFGVPTLHACHVDAATAAQIVARLAGPLASPSHAEIEERLVAHDRNLRNVLFELYDRAEANA